MSAGSGYEAGRPEGRRTGAGRGRALHRACAVALVALVALALGAIAAQATGGATSAETEPASSIGRTGAVLNARVDPNGSPVSECYFEYGASETELSGRAPCSISPGELETPVPVEAALSGLSESGIYYFRIHANGAGGEASGGIRSFSTLPTTPGTNVENPSALGRTTATLSAAIKPNDSEVTECFFEWGTISNDLSNRAECSPAPGAGSEPVVVSAPIEGLTESNVYYYRVVARNGLGSERSSRNSFETLPSRPKVGTDPNSPFGRTTATLVGHVTPEDAAIESCFFQWGSASVEEHSAPCEQTELGSGEARVAVTANLTGLTESTTYRYRLVASNDRGSEMGATYKFTTLPYLPKATVGEPRDLTDESGLFKGRVNPQGRAITECRFEYGTTIALGKKVACSKLPGSGEGWEQITAPVSGLEPSTGYYVRVRVANAYGAVYSGLEPFTTFSTDTPPVVKKLEPNKGDPSGGNSVTVVGEHLDHAVAVVFGETRTTQITADSTGSLTVTAPAGTTGAVEVVVITEGGQSALVHGDRYTYSGAVIGAITPHEGPRVGGTEVTVTGAGFEPGAGGTVFLFGKTPAADVTCETATQCTLLTPAGSKTGTVKLKAVVNGKSGKPFSGFTYTH